MFTALATLADRRRWLVAVVAVVVAAAAGVLGAPVAGLLSGGGFDDPHSDSSAARTAAAAATGLDTASIVVLLDVPGGLVAPASHAAVAHVDDVLRATPEIGLVVDMYAAADPALVSRDGRQTTVIGYWKALPASRESDAAKRITSALAGSGARIGGLTVAQNDVQHQVSDDLAKAEALAFPILFVLLIIVFRGVIAALLPLMVGGLTIITSLLGLRLVNNVDSLSIFALNLVTGLGLGLGIDYSLLILSRYREEIAGRADVGAALRRTMNTAGRTVLFSSLTVAAALASLIVFPEKFLYSMAIGGVIGVVAGAVIALTVLPAVLALLGTRIDRLALPHRRARSDRRGAWYTVAGFVMRRPVAVAAMCAGVLIVMGLPFLRIQFTSVDASVLPESYVSRQVSDALIANFPPAHQSPVSMIITASPSDSSAVADFATRVHAVSGVAEVTLPRQLDAHTWEVDAALTGQPLDPRSQDAVHSIRSLNTPFAVLVGGQTATFLDLQASLAHELPIALGIVAAATLVVLFAATGSVVLPIKALAMNLLSLSATFGLLVLIFQDGRFTGLLGYTSQGALESTQPILLFALAFGLSTDYGVFLLTRIKEAHDAGAPNRDAVSTGLQRTGRIITAAAALFCVAIGSFATSQIIFIKELGIGTAVAVLVDASLVRAFLVPALMALLGDWNWWAPRPLRRLHRRLGLDRLEVSEHPAA